MPGLRQRRQPLRLPDLMAFAHEHLAGPCCVCLQRPWRQLHHFGADGGRGCKPSDHLVARLCRECAVAHEIKARALLNAWWHRGDADAADLLLRFYADAAEIQRAYLAHTQTARPRGKGTQPCQTKK